MLSLNDPERALYALEHPESWPFRVLCPLAHRTRVDSWGMPLCGVVAVGHRSKVFLANLGDFKRGELQSQKAFDAALKRFKSTSYISYRAILADGWRID